MKAPRGSAIPGSSLLRWYCDDCGEPIGITRARYRFRKAKSVRTIGDQDFCEGCSGDIAGKILKEDVFAEKAKGEQ